MLSLIIVLLYICLLFFSLSMTKHSKSIFIEEINPKFKKSFLILGYILLFISLVMSINEFDISMGIIYWLGIITPLIVFLALFYTYFSKYILEISIAFIAIVSFINYLI